MSVEKWEAQGDWERAALEPTDTDLGYPPDGDRKGDPVVIDALDDAPSGWAETAIAAFPSEPDGNGTNPEAAYLMNESTVCDLEHWQ